MEIKSIIDASYKEAAKRFRDGNEGYDLWSVDAFVTGAKIVHNLIDEKRSPLLNPNILIDGYHWAIKHIGADK